MSRVLATGAGAKRTAGRVAVLGAAGFIGHHLVRYLKDRGHWVRAVDIKAPLYDVSADETDWKCDLRSPANANRALREVDEVYTLAATMGGMGFISNQHLTILIDNMQINTNVARAAEKHDIKRLLFSSTACVYPERLQTAVWSNALTEDDAWHGKPDTAYGVEKLCAEELYLRLAKATDTEVRIARFHNIYGPKCTWDGGREKAPAALCRKVAIAKKFAVHQVEIWGDGQQTRSFCHISDCLEMLHRLMRSDHSAPLNIGTNRAVTINELVDIIAWAAGIEIEKRHVQGPQGVRGRNADLSLCRRILAYKPQHSLEQGIAELYQWVEAQCG